jgi:RNA 3'-terminal phosphate cyclase (ATP)
MEVVVRGGTNVPHSPSVDYFEHVLFPILNEKALPTDGGKLKISVEQRCWGSSKGSQLGSVRVSVPLLRWGEVIPGFRLVERGETVKIEASIIAPANEQRAFQEHLVAALENENWKTKDVKIDITLNEDSGGRPKTFLLLVATTENGFCLGRDVLYDSRQHKRSNLKGWSKLEYMVEACIEHLQKELAHGGCVDEFLEDQIVVFQALAEGESKVDGAE